MDMNELVGQVSEVERLIRTRETRDLAEVMRSLQRIMCEAAGIEVKYISMLPEEHEHPGAAHRQRESARWIRQDMERLTHRRYNVEEALAGMGVEALHELRRFVRDAESEADLKARKAAMQPWRRP